MKTYLLTWSPNRSHETEIDTAVTKLRFEQRAKAGWSTGSTKRIQVGDRVFLLRQGPASPGLVGSGIVTKANFRDIHWDESKRAQGFKTNYIRLEWDAMVLPVFGLSRQTLLERGVSQELVNSHASGVQIPTSIANLLERLWAQHLSSHGRDPFRGPEEVATDTTYPEGALCKVTVNAYERNPKARAACLAHYGRRCSACGFDFEAVFGLGTNGIHVHHLRPLAEIRKGYEVDPIADLRPVCPNCHAVIHSRIPARSIDEVKKLRKSNHVRSTTR
jgi:5-methylcytosine-specific restriction protein A